MRILRHLVIAAIIGLFAQAAVSGAVSSEVGLHRPEVPALTPLSAEYRFDEVPGITFRIDVQSSRFSDASTTGWEVTWRIPVRDPHGGFQVQAGGALVLGDAVYALGDSGEGTATLRHTVFAPGLLPCGLLRHDGDACISPEGIVPEQPGRWRADRWDTGTTQATFVDGLAIPVAFQIVGESPWHAQLERVGMGSPSTSTAAAPPLQPGQASTGIDDRELGGYTMQDAWQDAKESITWRELADYLRRFPAATMTAARPLDDGWSFEVGHSSGHATFRVLRPDATMALLGPRFSEWQEREAPRPPVPVLASAQSVVTRAAAWTGTSIDRVGFVVSCADDCTRAAVLYSAHGADTVVEMDGSGAPVRVTAPRSVDPSPRLAGFASTAASQAAAIATGTGLAAGALYLLVVAAKAPVTALFSRVSRANALRHPARLRLHDIVESDPGIHREALRRRADMAPGQLQHHLGILLREGLLREANDGRLRHLYLGTAPVGPIPPASPGARRVLEALHAGASTRAGLARATGLDPSTVGYHLQRLETNGQVVRHGRDWHPAGDG